MDTHEVKIPKEKPSEIVCTFCMKPTCQDFANIQQKSDLLELLKKLNVDILPVNDQIDWICYQCTYKLNCIRDYARTWASCVTKNRINYYYRLGEKEMVRRLLNLKSSKPLRSLSIDGVLDQNALNSSHNKNEFKLKIASVRSIDVNDIPTTLSTIIETNEDNNDVTKKRNINDENIEQHIINEENIQNEDDENEEDNEDEDDNDRDIPEQELLSVMYEKSESVLNTESGGHIHYRNNKPNNKPTLLTCKQCYRVYKKLSFLKKHERKHDRDNRDHLKTTIIQIPTIKQTTIKCKDCDCIFTSLTTWRNHYQIHQSQLKCSYCPAVFILPADLQMHEAICYGVRSAKSKKQSSHRYMTRSAHRTNNNDDDENSTISEVDTMYTKRLENARDWVSNAANIKNNDIGTEEELQIIIDDDDDDDCKSLATTFTRASSRFNNNTYTEGEEDDNDDDLSTLTRPSAPSKDTLYRLKKRNKETDSLCENAQKRSKISKNLIDKLVKCPDKNCNFITTSIERLQEHDLTVHDELPLFSCNKCKGRFLRQFYLKDHLYEQNPGRFICIKCERIFEFERELKFHLTRHDIIDNNDKSNYCQYCNLTFVNVSDYYHHLETFIHKERNPEMDLKTKTEDFEYEYEEEEEENEKSVEQKKLLEIIEEEEIAAKKLKVSKDEKPTSQQEKTLLEEQNENLIIVKDFFIDEKKNLAYIQMLEEDDINTDSKINCKTVIPIKVEELTDNDETEENEYFQQIQNEKFNSLSYKIKMDLKENVKKQFKRVEPYKTEIRIRQFDKPFKRRHEVVFRQWKPHSEPLRMIGANYLNCAIKPYRNLS